MSADISNENVVVEEASSENNSLTDNDYGVVKCELEKLQNTDDASETQQAFEEISSRCADADRRDATFDALLKLEGCNVIITALEKWMESGNVVSQGLSALHNSSLCEEIAVEYVTKYDAFNVVAKCMSMYPEHLNLQTRACGAIGILMKKNETSIVVQKIQDTGVSTLIGNAMNQHPDDAKLHRWALKALDIMTSYKELKEYHLNSSTLVYLATAFDRMRKLETNPFAEDIHEFAISSMKNIL